MVRRRIVRTVLFRLSPRVPLPVWLILAIGGNIATATGGTEPLPAIDQVAAEWVKTRVETARIETEWSTQRPLLESTVNGLVDRAQTLESKRDFITAKTAKDRGEMATIDATNKAALAELQEIEPRARAMSDRLIALRSSLPPRLSAALEMSYRSLASPTLTLSERTQLNLVILNRCTQFNRSITCEEEGLDVAGSGQPQVLEVVYWGLSHGYALDRPAGKSWLGRPAAGGWRWEPLPDSAPAVASLISIYHDKADPAFVNVPAHLEHATVTEAAPTPSHP
jgi:Protein of unknown function (DUF3450)